MKKDIIFRLINIDPGISQIDKILAKLCPKFLDLYASIYGACFWLTSTAFDLEVDVVGQGDLVGDVGAVREHDLLIGFRKNGEHLVAKKISTYFTI